MNTLTTQKNAASAPKPYKLRPVLLALLALTFAGCQTSPTLKREINPINKLKNPNFAWQLSEKIANIHERDQQINALLAAANEAWQTQDFDKLNSIYQEIESYDPGNLRARDGLLRVEMAKNHAEKIQNAQALLENNDANKNDGDTEKAFELLHQVLLENPSQAQALPLYNQLVQQKEQKERDKLTKKLSYNQPATIEFRDIPLKQVFESLAKTTKINFILDKDVPSEQKVTLFVKNMAFQDALDLLLQTNQLEKKVLGDNSAIIYVNDALHQRDYKDLILRSYTLDYADVKTMSNLLKNMLNIKQIEIDPRLNTLILKDSADILALAEKVIASQDLPDPEVMLEMQVMEIKSNRLQNLGVTPPAGVSVPVPSSKILTVRDLRDVTGNSLVVGGVPGLVFNASEGDVNLLANPRIRVKNRDIARIHIGEKVPVFTSNVASTGVSSQTVQYIDAGLKLEVEPVISNAGDVSIKINLNVGSIGDKIVVGSGASESVAFRVGTRLTTTQLRLRDGETQVLAGLIDDQDRKNISGLPGLSKLPLIGRLFGTQADDKTKTEIVLAITPHIIRERKPQSNDQAEMWIGSESQTGRKSVSPSFGNGLGVPFLAGPRPASNADNANNPNKSIPAPPPAKPENINIPLPAGFSLGPGLSPSAPLKSDKLE